MKNKVILSYQSFFHKAYAFLRFKIAPIEEIEKHVRGKVLDIGCGYGVSCAYFALMDAKRSVYGCDFDGARIKTAKKAFSGIKNLRFSIHDLIKTRDNYDTILLIDVLHHIDIKLHKKLIDDCMRHLNSRGALLIKEIDTKPYPKYLFNYFHDRLLNKGPYCYRSCNDLSYQLRKSGFKVKCTKLNNLLYSHYIIECSR